MKPFGMDGRTAPQGLLDFSDLLDAPAGKYGFIQVKDGHFFEGGRRIRFFGSNLVLGGCMPEKETAELFAERLAGAGVNMMRLHYADAMEPDGHSLIDYSKGSSRELNWEAIDRMDYLISRLKARGIYTHIDLFAGRSFLPGDDLDYGDDLCRRCQPLKTILLFNRRLIELQKEFAAKLLTHVSPYTGNALLDEPAVAIVQMVNEDSMVWTNAETKQWAPSYYRELDLRWNEWLLRKYGSRAGLDEAWTNERGTHALYPGEDPGEGSVERPLVEEWVQQTSQYWDEYRGIQSPARFADHIEFLTGIQKAYCGDMYAYLRRLGVKVPISFSNLACSPADAACYIHADVVENNAYWNHPYPIPETVPRQHHRKEMIATDPRQTMVPFFEHNLISRLAWAPAAGKPFLVTEWNSVFPTAFNADAMPMAAAYGALQDWDGLLFFSYTGKSSAEEMPGDRIDDYFFNYMDPAAWGQMGLCAAIFRRGLVKTARSLVHLGYGKEDLLRTPENWTAPYGFLPFVSRLRNYYLEGGVYNGGADAVFSAGFTPTGDYTRAKRSFVFSRSPYGDRFHKRREKDEFLNRHAPAGETADLLANAGWQRPHRLGAVDSRRAVVTDERPVDLHGAVYSQLADSAMKHWGLWEQGQGLHEPGRIVSDTGELTYDFAGGFFRIDAEEVLVYAGLIPEGGIVLGRFEFSLENRKMALTLLPRDGKSVAESGRLLLAAVGENGNSGMVWQEDLLVCLGGSPMLIDQLEGVLLVRGIKSADAYALGVDGSRIASLRTAPVPGGTEIDLHHDGAAIYYELILG